MNELKGKVAVVTGASKGIGAAIARSLGAAGAAVTVNYTSSKEDADRVVGDIKANGRKRVQVPPSGFYIATLVTNDVISIEGDQLVLRHTGDSWAVPAGQPLVLEPQGKNHTVLLEVFRVEPSSTR